MTIWCCLPLGIAGAAGALGLAVFLDYARPWLMAAAVLLLAVGLLQLLRNGRSCQRQSRTTIVLFALSAAVVMLVLVFPEQLAALMASVP